MRRQPPQGTEEYRVYKRGLEFAYANTEHGFLKRLFQSIFTRVKGNGHRSRKYLPRITKDGLKDIYDEQVSKHGKRCLYCGEEFTFTRLKRNRDLKDEKIKQVRTNCSIDRYDPSRTYQRGNIVFCCWDCNFNKGSSNINDWVNFLKVRKKIIK